MRRISITRRRRWAATALATAAATALTACGTSSVTTGSGGRPLLKMAAVFLPSALDPAKGIDAVFSFVETLTQINAQGQVVPFLLATAPAQTDPTHWTLTLRSDVTFQDGHAMTPQIVAAALNREVAQSEQAQSELAKAVFAASGTDQITVTTPKPEPLLPADLADRAFAVYDEPVVTAAGSGPDALVGKGVFTAPYAITGFTEQGMTLAPYDKYWQGKPALGGVQVSHVADGQARVAAVESGQVDIADGANAPDIVTVLKGRGDVTLKTSEAPLNILKLFFNPASAPFNDTRVRQALAVALDYRSLATQFTGGVGEPAASLLPSSHPLAVPTQTTNVAQARQLLDAAGWTAGADGIRSKNGTPLTVTLLTYSERPVFKPLSIGIQSMLATIGATVNIVTQPFDYKMYNNPNSWNLALYNDYSISPTGVPDSYLGTYLSTNGSGNHWHISDSTLDGLLSTLAAATTADTRKDDLAAVQHYVWDNAYVAAVAFVKDGSVVSKNWANYTPGAGYQQQEWTWQTAPSA